MLKDRNILLGITGSIAAYKSIDLARRLTDEGAKIRIVMTESACRFVTPYLFEAVTGNSVSVDLFKDPYSHINLSRDSHLFIIAPATANTINKLSCGIADNLLCNLWLTCEGPLLIAPAMNYRMYENPVVQKHIRNLRKSGVRFVGPASGSLACGEEGKGRMAEVAEIIEAAVSVLSPQDLKGHTILVTAGPTREPIDPARFLSNRSSGKMGYAVAQAALRRGAEVILISGPSCLSAPAGASFVPVERASEMKSAVLYHAKKATAVIMAAAVSDYTPAERSKVKLKKNTSMSLELNENTDILKSLGKKKGHKILIGFAAESGKDISSARLKLKEKNLDMIVLNDISRKDTGFDVDTNQVTLIDRKGRVNDCPLMKKIEAADIILNALQELRPSKKV